MKKFTHLFIIALAALAMAACNEKPEQTVAVTGVTLSSNSQAIEIGGEVLLTATVAPENATNRDVTWESSDKTVATVTGGLVKALSAGNATITVVTVDGKRTAMCTVVVAEEVIPVTGLKLSDPATPEVGLGNKTIDNTGETFAVKVSIAPGDATNKNFSWNYDDQIVSIVQDPADATLFTVTGLKSGQTTLTCSTAARDNNGAPFTASIEVTVRARATAVVLTPATISVAVDETVELTVGFEPADAYNKDFTFYFPSGTTSDPYVTAQVSQSNPNVIIITGKAAGGTALYVKAAERGPDNGDIVTVCSINVVQPATGLTFDKTEATISVGENLVLTPIFTPQNTSVKIVSWATGNQFIASVSAEGQVTGISTGSVNITATTTDGTNLTATCSVTVVESAPETPFGTLGFRSSGTWTGGNLVWSDYVVGSNCNKDTFSTSDTEGDCMQNIDGETVYYQLFSYHAIDKWRVFLCPAPWRTPTAADFQALDAFLYPSDTDHTKRNGCDEYMSSKWGGEWGGFYNGGDLAIINRGTIQRLWSGDNSVAGRYPILSLDSNSAATSWIGTSFGRPTNNYGLGLRCVKDAQ